MDSLVEKHLAIILARGGSKRLPNKNILDFDSKPMIAWSIQAALNSKSFTKVIVSTDSEKIAKVSKEHGAEVPFLRDEGADDMTPSSEATLIAMQQAESYYGTEFEYVTQLMANCPLRHKGTIQGAVLNFLEKDSESQISCFKYGFMNPWWAFELNENGIGKKIFEDTHSKRSQDLPSLYCPTGAVWTAKRTVLKSERSFYSTNHTYYEISWQEGLDIDDADDFKFALATRLSQKIE